MKLDPIAGRANANLYRDPTTGIIYFRLSKKGKGRVTWSTKTPILTEARQIADDMRFKFLGTRSPKAGRQLNKELLPEWLETKRVRRASTFDRYRRSVEHLMPHAGGLLPMELDESWWEKTYIPAKRAESAGYTFANDRKTLVGYLKRCLNQGLISRFPSLIRVDKKSVAGKIYSDDEVKRLRAEASGDLQLQMLMALEMFMRKGEILLLALDRINPKKRMIKLEAEDTKTGSKTGTGREFPITPAVWALIEPRLDHPSGFLFPSRTGEARPVDKGGNQSAWEGCKTRAKVKGRFHDLRHTALSKFLTKPGANIALICKYAGITLEEAERTYLHIKPEQLWSVAEVTSGAWE